MLSAGIESRRYRQVKLFWFDNMGGYSRNSHSVALLIKKEKDSY